MQYLLQSLLPFELTEEQQACAQILGDFLVDERTDQTMILRGYAGTGKTSLVGAFVRALEQYHIPTVLLAPTGRAAKVFSLNAGKKAFTIHKTIYRQKTFNGEDTPFQLGFNKLKNAVFIVDEASMISSGSGSTSVFGNGMLLDDLIHYVFEGEGCRLLLVGDTAQLPPVGEDESPALQKDVLEAYGLRVREFELTNVVRQSHESRILANATTIRQFIDENPFERPKITFGDDVVNCPGNELIEALQDAYYQCGTQGTTVVTRSNKQANIYNNGIRARIFDREEQLCRGDLVMAVKNNYFWTAKAQQEDKDFPMPFIANGDTAEVTYYRNVHEQYGFTFADATLRFPDYDAEIDCRIILDTLQSESPALTREEQERLYLAVLEDYADIPGKKERMKALREDPYYNALQIKFAYAVTCHKAQGGQWERVFIDQGYIPDDADPIAYLRWLYTAFTRATERLMLVNWRE